MSEYIKMAFHQTRERDISVTLYRCTRQWRAEEVITKGVIASRTWADNITKLVADAVDDLRSDYDIVCAEIMWSEHPLNSRYLWLRWINQHKRATTDLPKSVKAKLIDTRGEQIALFTGGKTQ